MKPSIFVVTGLIIIMLAFSFFVFHQKDKSDYLNTYAPENMLGNNPSNFSNWYNAFNNADEDEVLRNTDAIAKLANVSNLIEFYTNYDTENDGVERLKYLWNTIQVSYTDFCDNYKSNESNDTERNNLLSQIVNFENTYNSMIADSSKIYFFVKTEIDENISKYIFELKETYKAYNNLTTLPSTQAGAKDAYIINSFRVSGILDTSSKTGLMRNSINSIIQCNPNKNNIRTLETYISTATTRLIEQQDVIEQYYQENKDSSPKLAQITQLRRYIADYRLTVKYTEDIIKYGSYVYGIPKSIENSLTNYKNFQAMDLYQLNMNFNQKVYLFENQLYEYNYATPFSLSEPSNTSSNGFDFSYFSLRLCSLFITIYLVVLAAGTIAGEQSAGTLKLLAIRPFTRSKILTGKSLAIFAIGGILLAISSIATLVIGGVTYGFASADIMTVFNGTTTIVISPILFYFIAFLTMYIEILFYTSLSIFISTAFKTNVGAVSISTLAFFVSLILNGLFTTTIAIGFLPFTNISFFKYFGSSFIKGTNDFISAIISPGVFVGSTFWSSLIIYLISVAVLIYIPHLIFKNRDLK